MAKKETQENQEEMETGKENLVEGRREKEVVDEGGKEGARELDQRQAGEGGEKMHLQENPWKGVRAQASTGYKNDCQGPFPIFNPPEVSRQGTTNCLRGRASGHHCPPIGRTPYWTTMPYSCSRRLDGPCGIHSATFPSVMNPKKVGWLANLSTRLKLV